MKFKYFSQEINIFHSRVAPEKGVLVGYGAVIEALNLAVPMPKQLAIISYKNRQYQDIHWKVFPSRYLPQDQLYNHLIFAIKYEGINLLFYKKLFQKLPPDELIRIILKKPLGQYSRRIWFLYEWLMQKKIDLADLNSGNYVPLLNNKIQYAVAGKRSPRHRIVNNLPGTVDFCPLIYRTKKLDSYINARLSEQHNNSLKHIHTGILQRTAAFLLLKDSKASFSIEGERPQNKRAIRWGKAIGQAGTQSLNIDELLRLQQLVIENNRFVKMGFRHEGGFVGEHDRTTGDPLPEHISARWQDIEQLIMGLIKTNNILEEEAFDPVLAATIVAFGFVFIHPFQDGNGRIHRFLLHHVLARKNFTRQGLIFPVSASILGHIDDYRRVLQNYSHPLLDFIEWKSTSDNNVEVLNDTIDYYRYFDITPQAEFLYDCVHDTIYNIIPQEVQYLEQYDRFKHFLDNEFEFPDKIVALLIRFLEQNNGKLSKRAREKELPSLTNAEAEQIEKQYQEIFI